MPPIKNERFIVWHLVSTSIVRTNGAMQIGQRLQIIDSFSGLTSELKNIFVGNYATASDYLD